MSEDTKQPNIETKSVLDYLQSVAPPTDGYWSIEVSKNDRSGTLHLNKQGIIAAQSGPLAGNGALLTIASWRNLKIRRLAERRNVQKNVTLSFTDIHTELAHHPPQLENGSFDEIACLKQAILQVYRFRFQQAGAKLAEILRYNRYNYIAWLWYSRIVGKTESILKTLNEAQKWGNSDREIQLENSRTRLLLRTSAPTVKRCPFCWTALVETPDRCGHCHSSLVIQQRAAGEPAQRELVETAVARYRRVHELDPKNTQVAYCLALGYFNLGDNAQALAFLHSAAKYAPGEPRYTQAIEYLEPAVPKTTPAPAPPPKLPASPAVSRPPVSPAQVMPASSPKPNQKSILVIEDSKTSRKVISMVLTREGFNVVEASTGSSGIMLGRETTPSLILLDVMLPDMTGYEVLPRLKEMPHLKHVPAIMLTGKTGSADRVLGMRAGSSEYLTKPFNPQKLIGIIKKYL